LFRKSSAAPPAPLLPDAEFRIVRKRLADGTVKEYRYPRRPVDRTPRFAPDSLDGLLVAYRRSPEWLALSDHTRETYGIYHRPLNRIGHVPAKVLTRRMILDIRDAIAVTRGPGAATGFVRATKALLSWAADRGVIDQSPAYGIRGVAGGHLPAWTEAVLARAMATLPEAYRRVAVLALYTGQRRGDLIGLTWNAYDGAAIRLRQGKTKRALVIPAHQALRAELEAWKAEGRTATTILTSPRGLAWTAQHLSREMTREVGLLGLGRFTVHGLRKLAAVRLAEAGCTVHEICAILGWKSLSMAQLYTESADQESLAQAAILRLETRRVKPG
jgi:integrase